MKSYLAEVFGTFLLVFIGCASIVMGGLGGALPVGQIGIGLAFGLGLVAAAYAIGPISGAHLNPAVTLGFFLAGRLPAKDVIPYWIAQVIGAGLATVALWIMVAGKVGDPVTNFGATTWDSAKWGASSVFLTEVIATFTFVLVILASTSAKHMTMLAGLIIGLTLAGGILLLWVSWRFWRDISAGHAKEHAEIDANASLRRAIIQITLADVSMSLDNVLAVAGAARDHLDVLIIGLLMSVALMGAAANLIARLLERYRWISYLGLAIVVYVALSMIWSGSEDVMKALG